MKALSSSRMRRADRLAAERYGIPAHLLMENAGRAVADAAESLLKRKRGTVLVLCGGGSNGGDGIAAARTLHNRSYRVEVWLLKDPSEWKGSLALHYQMARRMGVRFKRFSRMSASDRRARLKRAVLVIDALLGTGTRGEIRGDVAIAIQQINASSRPVLAVDLPSGLDADTGNLLGPCVRSSLTVTMAAPKPGLLQEPAQRYVGRLVIAEIGIPAALLKA